MTELSSSGLRDDTVHFVILMQAEISTRVPAVPEFWRTSPPLVGRCREYLGEPTPAILLHSVCSSIALVSIAMLGYTGCAAVMPACPADVFPKSVVSSIWSLASMESGFGGMVFALLTGLVSGSLLLPAGLIGFGTMPLICAGILWALVSPIRPRLSWGTFGATS